MNETDQRIAIMEALGWSHIEDRSESLMMPKGSCLVGYPPKGAIVGKKQELPELDLDLMHLAEHTLNKDQEMVYLRTLNEVITRQPVDCWKALDFSLVHATASERAEAFLRVKGKWKD